MREPAKIPWLERAKDTHNYHVRKKQEDPKWTTVDSARSLKRSLGSISEDLKIASWMKTHLEDLMKFDYAKDAIAYIRDKEEKMMMDIIP